ncbi:ABC transporter ATP-binding protein [Sinobaca sp. H24]|uniref:ABC transporter ATP-binding protein n=1 Tax=Sinobaca sp. H24 TaxID=2923376 RepID=UPI00207956C6|nr:ABC transporter ATP-binding protein [Sinobaca sp. H24]
MTILETTELTKTFGRVKALDQVSIEMKEGEVYGFIGPNGAGKSTTLRVLLGAIKATSGTARIFGKDVWKDAVAVHRRLAYVPGDVNLWPNLTGGEVIDLFMKLHGTKNTKKRSELIELFDLDPAKKCGTYSKGNRQKVALVAAFASEVDLYIMDEPTSGLDPLMEKIFQQQILEARENGKSVLLSSHILSEVEKLCDRVSIIRQGKIIETGSLTDLRHLTRTTLLLETKKPPQGLSSLKGVHEITHKEEALQFQVDTEELEHVMAFVSSFGITRLESAPPTLEDLFLRHYETARPKAQ